MYRISKQIKNEEGLWNYRENKDKTYMMAKSIDDLKLRNCEEDTCMLVTNTSVYKLMWYVHLFCCSKVISVKNGICLK